MREISVSLWEATPDEINALPDGTQYLTFYPEFQLYGVRTAGVSGKVPQSSKRKYFLFEEPQREQKEKKHD